MGAMEMTHDSVGRVVGDYGRDGKAFAHRIETLRDSLLHNATRVEFRLHSMKTTVDKHGKTVYTDDPQVPRLAITDNGTGMSKHVLDTIFANVGISGTVNDLVCELTSKCDVVAKFKEYKDGDYYHARKGMGSRASTLRFNKMGMVTTTVHEGVARLIWLYIDTDGNPRSRDYFELDDDGIPRKIVSPLAYTENDFLTKAELKVDIPWSAQLLVRTGMVSDSAEARDFINGMSAGDKIPNPYAGIEWDGPDTLPEWVVARWDDETGLAYGPDGELAHGTTKVLLGDRIDHPTAVTGDPFFDIESEAIKAGGFGNQFFVDLSHWEVWVEAVRPERTGTGAPTFDIVGMTAPPDKKTKAPRKWSKERFSQDGALWKRRRNTSTETKVGLTSPNIFEGVLDLGDYGRAVVLYAHPFEARGITKNADWSAWQASRAGVTGVVYNYEVHGLHGDSLKPQKSTYLAMGFPVYNEDQVARLTMMWFPPRLETDPADEKVIVKSGLHQSSARDRVKWNGSDLPLHGKGGLYEAIAAALPAQADDLLARLTSELDSGDDVKVVSKDIPELMVDVEGLVEESDAARKPAAGPRHVADAEGKETVTPDAPGTKPSGEARPDVVCEHGCTGKFHKPECPNHHKGGGGAGGPKGEEVIGDADADGGIPGRKSRARRKVESETATTKLVPKVLPTPPTPPNVKVVLDADEWAGIGEADDLALWTPAAPLLEVSSDPDKSLKIGMIHVNGNHLAYQMVEGWMLKQVRNKRDKASVREATKTWIKARVAESLMIYLAQRDQPMSTGADAKSLTDLREWIVGDEDSVNTYWFGVFAGIWAGRQSLKSYVVSNTAVSLKKEAA